MSVNPFDSFMSSMEPDKKPFEHTCETVHPLIDDAMSLLLEDCMKVDKEQFGIAIEQLIGGDKMQMIVCLTTEILRIYENEIRQAEEDAVDLMTGVMLMGDDNEAVDDEAWFVNSEPGDEALKEDGEIPLLLPYSALESLVKKTLQIGLVVMPYVSDAL